MLNVYNKKKIYFISKISVIAAILLILVVPASIHNISNTVYAQRPTTFPPPILYQLKDIPSYAITIPFSSSGESHFEPSEINIPLGMTVIWFNNDNAYHTVTTVSNSSITSPENFDSNFIPANGGSYIHTFNKIGTYDYFDKQNPSSHGRIIVTGGMEKGKHMNMLIGGNATFNPNELSRITLRFVPTDVTLPPAQDLGYNVTLLDSKGSPLFSHSYLDSDGILDLELVPIKTNTTKTTFNNFTTWGPDFSSQEAFRTTGTFHIKGPVLIQDSQYGVKVDIVSLDNNKLSSIGDIFVISPKINATSH